MSTSIDPSAETPRRQLGTPAKIQSQHRPSRYASVGAHLGYYIGTGIGLFFWSQSPGSCLAASVFFVIVCPVLFFLYLTFTLLGIASGAALGWLIAGFIDPYSVVRMDAPKTPLLFKVGWCTLTAIVLMTIYLTFQYWAELSESWHV